MSRRGALPTFLVIGAPKAGSTSFHHYLDQHPEIQMAGVKEPTYFAPPQDPRERRRSFDRRTKYEQLFDPDAAVRGEASTAYAEYPFRQGVPERIKELVPEAKLIYLVRDPVERTLSHYHHFVASEGERRPIGEVLADLSDPRIPCVCASLYALQLELFLREFQGERILVIDQADLLSDRRATLKRVFAFLGVDEMLESSRFDLEYHRSTERRRYPPRLAGFVGRTVRPRTRWMPARLRRSLRVSAERMLLGELELETLDTELRRRLVDLYASDAERLRELTGLAFSTWSV